MLPLTLDQVGYSAGGRDIIRSISCDFGEGTRTIILGANGAGKSVLMRLCHGLLTPTRGTVRWHQAAQRGEQGQAMVFQRPVLLRRSVLGNVVYALKLAGIEARDAAVRARQVLAAVNMSHLADHPARVLSGGEQQRLALARAWALKPAVLFLDEPTASLDPHATRHIEAVIGAIHASGTKIIMSTHSLGQARRLGDEVLFLSEGRLVERASVQQFFKQPRTEEAAQFLQGE